MYFFKWLHLLRVVPWAAEFSVLMYQFQPLRSAMTNSLRVVQIEIGCSGIFCHMITWGRWCMMETGERHWQMPDTVCVPSVDLYCYNKLFYSFLLPHRNWFQKYFHHFGGRWKSNRYSQAFTLKPQTAPHLMPEVEQGWSHDQAWFVLWETAYQVQ